MGHPTRLDFDKLSEPICKAIRDEADAVENFVRDVDFFLSELPHDLGRGSLNEMKAQLQQKCRDYLSS